MGAAAGGASGRQDGVLAQLACVPTSCAICSASTWKRRRYEALPPVDAQEMLKVPSYSPLGESPKAEDLRGLRKTFGLALLAVVLGVVGLGAAVLALSTCARMGGSTCGQELAGWARLRLGVGSSNALYAQDRLAARSAVAVKSERHEAARALPVRATGGGGVAAEDTGGDGDPDYALAAVEAGEKRLRSASRSGEAVPTHKVEPVDLHTSCGTAEDDMCYVLPEVYRVSNVQSPEECCRKCQTFPGGTCLAWTWGRDCAGDCNRTCVLKGAPNYEDEHIAKVKQRGVVSSHFQPKPGEVPMLALKAWPDTLFCFALVRPEGPEGALLGLQHERGWGIFDCEDRSFYSSKVFQIAPGVRTSKVDSDLRCKKGGEFGTALNSWIFIAVWRKVAAEGTFRQHDWTVKVDPDAVWFPDRLRIRLQEHRETRNGVYLNNCQYGLHGPLEVLSKKAASAYVADLQKGDAAICVQEQEFGGWGEDMFLDQCLLRHLRVERDNDFQLLCEDHCDCPAWSNCSDGSKVAFHPFKSEEDFERCVANAEKGYRAAS